MFLKLKPLLFSLIFLAGLEAIALLRDYVLFVVLFLFLISIYQGRAIGQKWKFSVLPAFFTLSSVALLYLITLIYEEQIFIFLAFSLYYLSLLGAYRLGNYEKDKTARAMNMAATAATVFFTYAGIYGLYLNFAVPLYFLMLVYLVVTLLVSYQYFSIIYPHNNSTENINIALNKNNVIGAEINKENKKIVWTYSFILALVMAELVWTINFWPFGYLTSGVIALILYYVLWDMVQAHFLNLLSKKRVAANLIFFSLIISLVLLSSKWIPVI